MFVRQLPTSSRGLFRMVERRFLSSLPQLPFINFEEYRNKCQDGRFDEPVFSSALNKIKVIEEEHDVIGRNLENSSKEKKDFLLNRIDRITALCTQNFPPTTKTRQSDELKVLLSSIPDHYQSLRLALTEEERSKDANRDRFLTEYGKKKSRLLFNEQKEYENSAVFQAFLEKIGQEFCESPRETIYFAYAWPTDTRYATESWVQPFLKNLQAHLKKVGFPIVLLDIVSNRYGANINTFMRGANESKFVLLFGTESLLDKFSTGTSAVCSELIHILRKREKDGKKDLNRVFPILLSGQNKTSFPPEYERFSTIRDWRDTSYLLNMQHLFLELLGLPPESYGALLQEYWDGVCERFYDLPNGQFYEEQRRKLDSCRPDYNLQDLQEIAVSAPLATNFNSWDLHPHFVGRKKIFKDISDHFQNNMVCLLFGLSGMGKTQVAFHYAKQAGYSQIWVINRRNEFEKTRSYKEIARKLKLYVSMEEEVFLQEKVHAELEKNSGEPWLLIYDNVTTREELQTLPQRGGNILITTTQSTLWSKKDRIEIDSLHPDEAIELLETVTGEPRSSAMEDLAQDLGNCPLALSLAANCIADTTTIAAFSTSFDPIETSLPKDLFYEHTIQTVWKKTLGIIEKEEPLALTWLEICSYLDPSHLPNGWIGEWLQETQGDQKKALVISHLLTSLAVFKKRGENEFSLHPLLQKVIRNKTTKGKEAALSLIQKQVGRFSEDDTTTWDFGRQGVLHACWLVEENLLSPLNSDQDMDLIYSSGFVSLALKDLRPAEKLNQVALAVAQTKHINEPHSTIAVSLNNLGLLWQTKGDLDQASQLLTQALEMYRVLYKDSSHPATADTLYNLGWVWKAKGHLDHAVQFLSEALKMYEDLHKDSPHYTIARALDSLGCIWQDKGDLDQALQHLTQALEVREKLYKASPHPDIAGNMNNLGLLWQVMGDLDLALQLLTQALEMQKQLYKEAFHPAIAGTLNNLGFLYLVIGDLDKALHILTEALEMNKRLYRDTPHFDTASTLDSLGCLWQVKGDLDLALQFYMQAFDMHKQLYKDTPHHDTAALLNNFGRLWREKGDLDKAVQFFMDALNMYQQLYKDLPHQSTVGVLNNLGLALQDRGDQDHPLKLYSEALKMQKKLFRDSPHPNTAGILQNLGLVWQDKGDLDYAIQFLTEALNMYKQLNDETPHVDTAKTLECLGEAWKAKGDVSQSSSYLQQSYEMREHLNRMDHPT